MGCLWVRKVDPHVRVERACSYARGTCTHTRVFACVHTRIHECTRHICTHTCLHVYTHGMYMCTCVHTHVQVHTCIVLYAHMCVVCAHLLGSPRLHLCVRTHTPLCQAARSRVSALLSSSSICSASYFSVLKTLAVSSRKLCLCGNEVPTAPGPPTG